MIWNSVRLALRSIQRNLMRSALTILGVVIGVAAVITMVNAGQGATALVGEQIASMGSNLIVVGPGQSRGPGSPVVVKLFEIEDARAIRNELDSMIEAIAPSAETKLITVNGAETWSTTVLGTTSDFFDVRDWPLESGRRFYAGEESSGAPVCILGATVREKLFGQQSPLGERIRAGKFSCRVVGLMSAKGQTTMGTDQDDRIVIPIGTYWRRVAGNRDVSYMQISARDGIDTQRLTERIAGILRDRRNIRTGEDDDFHVRDMKEIANTLAGATRVLTVLLGAIAAVSLIVGGIGIMNIMLVSVTERTREIGIRQAIGALEQDVLLQFLVEAVVLSSLGGVVGILISIIASYIMALVLNSAFFYDITIAFVAFLFSAAVGVIFGYLPARKAARMDPIEALRRE